MSEEHPERNTWAVLRQDEWLCERCGESIPAPTLPMRLATYAAMADAFATVHDGCPPPGSDDDDDDPACEVCGYDRCVCDECPVCSGSGWDDRDPGCEDVPCDACGGTGDDTQDLHALILSLPREVYLPHPITGIATACHPYIAPRQNGGPGNDDWEFGFQTEIGETFLHPATGRDLRQMIGFLMPFIRRMENPEH